MKLNENVVVDNKIVEFLDKAVNENLLSEYASGVLLTIAKTLIFTDKMSNSKEIET